MRLALLATLVACGSSGSGPDAGGPWQVTVDNTGLQGMVVSDPTGILCGRCAISPQGCPGEPATGSDCAAAFPVGTSVTLHVTEQQVYAGIFCFFDGATTASACTFVPTHATTVAVRGSTALR